LAITKTKDGKPLDFIHTFTGRSVRPLAITAEDIDIRDIAHSLAQQARWQGMSQKFYSVAEHSVRVSMICPAKDALYGLLHDAAEAYLKDLPAPVKYAEAFEAYRLHEGQVMQAIAEKFNLGRSTKPASVQRADEVMQHTEGRDLFPAGVHDEWIDLGMTQPGRLRPLGWEAAEEWFMQRYRALEKKRAKAAA